MASCGPSRIGSQCRSDPTTGEYTLTLDVHIFARRTDGVWENEPFSYVLGIRAHFGSSNSTLKTYAWAGGLIYLTARVGNDTLSLRHNRLGCNRRSFVNVAGVLLRVLIDLIVRGKQQLYLLTFCIYCEPGRMRLEKCGQIYVCFLYLSAQRLY